MASSRSGWQFRLSAGHPEKSNLVPQRVRPLGFNLEDGHEVLSMMPGSRRQGLWNLPRGIGDQVLKVRRGERGPAFLLSRARHRGRDRRGGALASGAGCLSAVDPGYDFVLTEVFRLPYRRGPVIVGKIGLLVIHP